LFLAGSAAALLMVVLPRYHAAFFGTALLLLFGGWVCWLIFLAGLGPVLRRDEVRGGAERVLWGGVRALAVCLPLLLGMGLLVAAMIQRPVLILIIPAGFVAALVTIAYHAGGFDSILGLLLAPTGIPFTLEYLNFIGGLRMLIERRS
jgi:hypothetical protein